MDLSIAIRTATVTAGKLSFSVGGGIVYDSIPADEHAETLHKGSTLMRALACQSPAPQYAWHNGVFKPQREASVSVDDEGFLYGFGFFETLRVQKGRPIMLCEHLDRFNQAWQAFFSSPPPNVTWEEIIRQLLERNRLTEKIAAVKILAAAGKPSNDGVPGTLLMTAREYRHRLEGTQKKGLHLVVYPHARHTHLADHKTMNYMFYRAAGRFAADLNADEAVILNIDRSVSETNTANIFCTIDDSIYTPFSEHALPGTMERAVRELLTNWGRPVANRRLLVEELKRADQVFLTNSLMGAVPVIRIDDTLIQPDIGLCQKINATLLE
jgi:para-aminobenzoate synthetase component I